MGERLDQTRRMLDTATCTCGLQRQSTGYIAQYLRELADNARGHYDGVPSSATEDAARERGALDLLIHRARRTSYQLEGLCWWCADRKADEDAEGGRRG